MDKLNESAIGIVFSKDRKGVLLIQRRDVPVWVLPGGGIEQDETPYSATIREMKEETGYDVKILKKVGEYSPINRLSRYTHLYECEILNGEPTIGNETKQIRFFSLTALPKYLPPPYDEWIFDAEKNVDKLIQRELTRVNYFTLIKNLFKHPILIFRFFLSRIGKHLNT